MGAAFLISHTFHNELKGFDEKFFLYVEDMDICYRCWKKNKKVVYYPLSKMTHVHQRSSQRLNKKTLIHLKIFFISLGKTDLRSNLRLSTSQVHLKEKKKHFSYNQRSFLANKKDDTRIHKQAIL